MVITDAAFASCHVKAIAARRIDNASSHMEMR